MPCITVSHLVVFIAIFLGEFTKICELVTLFSEKMQLFGAPVGAVNSNFGHLAMQSLLNWSPVGEKVINIFKGHQSVKHKLFAYLCNYLIKC